MQNSNSQGQYVHNVMQSGSQPIFIQAPGYDNEGCCDKVVERFFGKTVLCLGTIQLIIGILAIVLNVVGIVNYAAISFIGHGIWSGIFIILAGAFAIAAGWKKTVGLIVTCMVLCIFAVITSVVLVSMATVSALIEVDGDTTNIGLHTTLAIFAVVEFVVGIVTSGFCCHGACCCKQHQRNAIFPAVQYTQGGQGMQVILLQAPVGSQAIPLNTQTYGYNTQNAGLSAQHLYQNNQPVLMQQHLEPSASTTRPATLSPPPEYQAHLTANQATKY